MRLLHVCRTCAVTSPPSMCHAAAIRVPSRCRICASCHLLVALAVRAMLAMLAGRAARTHLSPDVSVPPPTGCHACDVRKKRDRLFRQRESVEAHVLQLIKDLLLREEVPAGGHEVPEGARGVDGGAAGDEKRNGAAKKKKKKKA